MSLKFLLSATYWGCMYFWSASPIVLKSWRPCFYLLLLLYEQQVRVSVCVALCPSLLDPHQGDSLNWSWVQLRKMCLCFSSTWQPCLPPWNRYLEIVSFCIIHEYLISKYWSIPCLTRQRGSWEVVWLTLGRAWGTETLQTTHGLLSHTSFAAWLFSSYSELFLKIDDSRPWITTLKSCVEVLRSAMKTVRQPSCWISKSSLHL